MVFPAGLIGLGRRGDWVALPEVAYPADEATGGGGASVS